ncbi:MAG TPA: TonB-dependent receptor, partial [Gemmatimonadaceae bacterium]|nr:TonB-dependent receptor [Gemmatimonadaceae bacterium]
EVSLVGAATAAVESVRMGALPKGLVDVTVADRAGHPLAGAMIDVTARGASFQSVHTDSAGRAQLTQVPSGRVELRVRRIGYRAGDVAVEIEPGGNTVPVVLDKSDAPSLDTVRIRGDRRVSSRLDDFETRRARGEATASISREEIEKRNPLLISQLLQNVPSVRFTEDLTGRVLPYSGRGYVMKSNQEMVPCVMAIMVDGVQMPDSTSLNLMSPRDLHGIEVFAGAASIPVKYGSMLHGQWCGLIALWTRDR